MFESDIFHEITERLWEHQAEPWVDSVLIFLYSGWRISELLALAPDDVDLEARTMKGGTKNAAGKNRIVPIHSKIRPLVEARLADAGPRLISLHGKSMTETTSRKFWCRIMKQLDMNHVPHECRHTFESRLDAARRNRHCIDLLMDHTSKILAIGAIITKTILELQKTIELLTT